jgi:hypothetical protein
MKTLHFAIIGAGTAGLAKLPYLPDKAFKSVFLKKPNISILSARVYYYNLRV